MTSKICGIIGFPLERTLSPALHEAGFRELELDWAYVPFRVEPGKADRAIEAMRVLGIEGLSVTIPHKGQAAASADELTSTAEKIGAVNTLFWSKDRSLIVGDNTDVDGFVAGLQESLSLSLEGQNLLLLGAGGSARAVAYAALQAGCAGVCVAARRVSAASDLVEWIAALAQKTWRGRKRCELRAVPLRERELLDAASRATLVVNATPVGSDALSCPLPDEAFVESAAYYDLIYYPDPTPFVAKARSAGAKAAGGFEMLVAQGALQFEIWTSRSAPVGAMRAAARACMNTWLQKSGGTAE
jgi:shikimate dehydrogenase